MAIILPLEECPHSHCPICKSEHWHRDWRTDDWNCLRCGANWRVNGAVYIPQITAVFCKLSGKESLLEKYGCTDCLPTEKDYDAFVQKVMA